MRSSNAPTLCPTDLTEHADAASQMLKALSNRNRLMVLCILIEGERTVSELLENVPLSQSALSQHLAVLRKDGLVTTRRESQSIYYSIGDEKAARLVALMHELYCGG